MSRVRVAVGIPSYREAGTIANVVTQADRGLAAVFPVRECVIVNVDGDSDDGTPNVFLATPTTCRKECIGLPDRPGGKGRNLLRFFKFCLEHDVEVVALLDADVYTISPSWVEALTSPLIQGGADFVVPSYKRSRFRGAATNHFAYPLVYGWFGLDIRQPIGGEFGMSRSFIEYLLDQPIHRSVLGYGIDMFLTLHAVGGGFAWATAALDRKVDKPNFGRFEQIAHEGMAAGVAITRQYRMDVRDVDPPRREGAIDEAPDDGPPKDWRKFYEEMRIRAFAFAPVYRRWMGEELAGLAEALETGEPRLSSEVWTDLLAGAILMANSMDRMTEPDVLAGSLVPLLAMRAVTFWNESQPRNPDDIEREVSEQVLLFRGKLLARSKDAHLAVSPPVP